MDSSYLIRSWLAKSMSSKVFQEVNSIVYFTAGNIRKPLSLLVGVHGDEEEEKVVISIRSNPTPIHLLSVSTHLKFPSMFPLSNMTNGATADTGRTNWGRRRGRRGRRRRERRGRRGKGERRERRKRRVRRERIRQLVKLIISLGFAS